MNTASDIINAFRAGEINISECWERLHALRIRKPANEPELKSPPSRVYEPLNDHEINVIERLQSVRFGANSGARSFVQQSKNMKEMTARQREYLVLIVYKYRRQLFRKDFDVRAKAYIDKMKLPKDGCCES